MAMNFFLVPISLANSFLTPQGNKARWIYTYFITQHSKYSPYLTTMFLNAIIPYLLIFPAFALAQSDSMTASSFRSNNPNDTFSVFMENESLEKPRKSEPTYSITITVTNIRNNKGVIRFKFYDEAYPFPHDKGFLRIIVPKSEVKDGVFSATYDGFTSKVMGIALQDDENSDWKLDMGWLLPKEGHAFSDYYHTALRKPVFSDFKFLLTGNKKVIMKMRYY
jgi:uncharacterized protein (DUF2141 family)